MQDYTLKFDEKEKFITNYTVEDGEITIHYANCKSFKTKYTLELEKSILEIMKNQVLEGKKYNLKQVIRRIKYICLWIGVGTLIITIPFNGVANLLGMTNIAVKALLGFVLSIVSYINIIAASMNIEDYKKNMSFIKNEELIFNNLTKEIGTFTSIKSKTRKAIIDLSEQIESTKAFEIREPNINTIEEVDAKSLEEIIDCINKDKEVKSYVKTKKLTRKK